MTNYSIKTREDGSFGLQRNGSNEIHGRFETYSEALEAIVESQVADSASVSNPMHY